MAAQGKRHPGVVLVECDAVQRRLDQVDGRRPGPLKPAGLDEAELGVDGGAGVRLCMGHPAGQGPRVGHEVQGVALVTADRPSQPAPAVEGLPSCGQLKYFTTMGRDFYRRRRHRSISELFPTSCSDAFVSRWAAQA